jgi:disulfide bond formation protein DsbB
MLDTPVPHTHLKFYFLVFVGMCAVILSALAFEHIGGYQPCKLCLEQREPWYVAIPLMALACISLFMKWPACLTRGLMLIGGLLMAYSLVLAIRHAGVEWSWWEGPGGCGVVEGGLATNTTDFLKQLQQTVPPSCKEPALRVLGLSFAGWNAIVSLMLGMIAFKTALSDGKQPELPAAV